MQHKEFQINYTPAVKSNGIWYFASVHFKDEPKQCTITTDDKNTFVISTKDDVYEKYTDACFLNNDDLSNVVQLFEALPDWPRDAVFSIEEI